MLIAPEVIVYVCVGHGNTVPVTSKLSCVVAALAVMGTRRATTKTRRPARLCMAILSGALSRVSSSPTTPSSRLAWILTVLEEPQSDQGPRATAYEALALPREKWKPP